MGTEVYPFNGMQVVDYGDIPCNPFNIPKVNYYNYYLLQRSLLHSFTPLLLYTYTINYYEY